MEEESGRDCGRGLNSLGVTSRVDLLPSGTELIDSSLLGTSEVLLSGEAFTKVSGVGMLFSLGPELATLLGSWNRNEEESSCPFDSVLVSDVSSALELDSFESDLESASLFFVSFPFLVFPLVPFSSSLALAFSGSRLSLRSCNSLPV